MDPLESLGCSLNDYIFSRCILHEVVELQSGSALHLREVPLMLGVQLEAKPIYRFQLVYIHQQFVQLAVVLHLQQSLELVETPLPQVALAILGQDVRQ